MQTSRVAAAVACALLLVGCGTSSTTTKPAGAGGTITVVLPAAATASNNPHSSTISSSTITMPAGEWNAASLLAGAYVRYLDGSAQATQLPNATRHVKQLAQAGGQIPAEQRSGPLRLVLLQPAPGSAPGSFYLTARDDAHTFHATEQLALRGGVWRVVDLTTPDFDQSLAPPAPRPAPPPVGSTAPRRAAERFLVGYLAWLYGRGPASAINDAAVALTAQLKVHPPNVPPAMLGLHARAAAVGIERHGTAWMALVTVTDSRTTYQVNLTLAVVHGRWLVSTVTFPGT